MQVNLTLSYRFDVTHEELNIIGLALCGRLKPNQEAFAHEINCKLLHQKRKLFVELTEQTTKAIESLNCPMDK